MPADASIYQQFLQPPKSIIDYQNQYNEADTKRNALQQSVLALQKGQMEIQNATDVNRQRNALRDAVTSGQLDLSNPDHAPRALALAPDVAPALLKTVQEGATARALAGKDNAQAGHLTAQTDAEKFKTRIAKSDQAIKDISGFQTPQDALVSLEQHAAAGDIPPDQAQIIRQQLTTLNPADFSKWQLGMVRNIMTAKDRMEYIAPTANTVANNTTSIATNAATNARVASEGAANRAQTARLHADTVANENLRAGVGPGGAMDENAERTAQAIASGQLPAPTGMALLNPKNQRILGRVMEINPQYDATTVSAKKKAASDFTTGALGNSMRSFQVAGQHLDQLGQLVDGLNNNNMQIVNKIGNMYASQTGNPAPTNFEAAKDVVSKEVVKAIVAGGGGVSERQELSHLMDNAKSPAQLKGVIQQYRNLMAAQHDALLQQRDAAGLPRSTLPNYTEPGGGGTAGSALPTDIANILKKHGGK